MNQSKKTEEMHVLACAWLIDLLGDIQISDLTFQDVRNWKEWMEKTKSINTVRGYIIKLRVVVAFISRRGYKVLDPELIGVPKRKTMKVDFLTEDEVSRLIDASFEPRAGYSASARYRNRAIIALLYASGIRVSELCSLNISDMRIEGSFTVIGKGDKSRPCFHDSRSAYYIKEYLRLYRGDNNTALFLSDQTSERISSGTVQMVFRIARRQGGFEQPIHPHTMRHSFATNLLRNNTNLLYVRDFLGHSSIQTTEMYTHIVNRDLEEIYAKKHTT